jgi:hypothetical protein
MNNSTLQLIHIHTISFMTKNSFLVLLLTPFGAMGMFAKLCVGTGLTIIPYPMYHHAFKKAVSADFFSHFATMNQRESIPKKCILN